jgi:HK97 family phage portal protein
VSVVRTRQGIQVETRAAQLNWGQLVPTPWSGGGSSAGVPVTNTNAAGLPAVGRALRLIGGLVGTAMIGVYEGRGGDKRERPDSPQALLLDDPMVGMSAEQWRYDIAVSLEVTENAYLRKIKTVRGKVVAIQVLQPQYVNASIDQNGDKQFEVSTSKGWKRVDAADIIHIRGHTIDGGPFGVSRIMQHRDPLGAQLAAQRFEGAYFRNSARPDVAVMFPQGITQEQGNLWTDNWNSKFAGPDNAGKAVPMGGGATIQPIEVNMRDAQFIESRQLGIGDVARMMDVEEVLLGSSASEQNDDQAMDRFLAFQLPPRLSRISSAFKADADLFSAGSALYPEFKHVDPMVFASPTTRAEVQHKQIQSGTLLPDEARADNGRPPLPDGVGQIPQVTPVGGAPNPDLMPHQPAEDMT